MSVRRMLLIASSLAVPVVLAVAPAGPAGAEPAGPAFGSHVSTCAQDSTGFTGDHNPSHHRGPAGWHAEHC